MLWDDVRLLLAVAREGSLSRAAKRLSLDHSTLSRRVAAFERGVGAPLFLRSARGMRPSPHGEVVLQQAVQVEKAMDEFRRSSASLARDQLRGPVRLASSGILAALLIPHFDELRRSAPDTELHWVLARQLVDLSRHEADVALRLRPRGSKIAEPSIVASRLGRVVWGLYAARRAKGRSLERIVRYSERSLEPGLAWIDKHMAGAEIVTRVDYVPAALSLASEGAGLAVLPCFLADAEPRLRRVEDNLDEHDIFAAVHADMRRVSRVAAVLSWLRSAVQQERARLAGQPTR